MILSMIVDCVDWFFLKNWMWDKFTVFDIEELLIGIGILVLNTWLFFLYYLISFTNNICSSPYHSFTFRTLQLPSPSHIHYPLPVPKIQL